MIPDFLVELPDLQLKCYQQYQEKLLLTKNTDHQKEA